MSRLLMLGAGKLQMNAIKRIKTMGHEVVVSDYYEDSPGKSLADYKVLADTFSPGETLSRLGELPIDGVLTTGTDQPVYTAAVIAETLGLPSLLDTDVAYKVTNKKDMKSMFSKLNLNTAPYALISEDNMYVNFDGPYVLKPIDSQGQRGIYKLDTLEEVEEHLPKTLSYSRAYEALLEKYYENKEVTVSGWVDESHVEILTVTDRVTFSSNDHIGVCISHEYPTIHQEHMDELIDMTHRICEGFKIKDGPIYFQFLVGDDGVYVNEIACRIGGAFEDLTIPFVTGFDILNKVIKSSLGEKTPYKIKRKNCVLSTQLFFCHPGIIDAIVGLDVLKEKSYILDADFYFKVGDSIGDIKSASQRAGHIVITGDSEEELSMNIEEAYDTLKVLSGNKNLVMRGKRYYR